MNIMRKFLSGSQSIDSAAGEPGSPGSPTPSGAAGGAAGAASSGGSHLDSQEILGLSHLRKLYAEYHNPKTANLGDAEKEEKIYMMLPLFCKVFGNAPHRVIPERFPDSASFAEMVSRLLVTEVRRRASNQSTEEAAAAIANFMEVEATEDSSNGWLLLTALNLLLAEGDAMAEVMTNASVPSTLVKCLYLFFDLPPLSDDANEAQSESEFLPKERRFLLQKMFIQVLLRLSAYIPAVEELARKDDLTLLFSAVTSPCPEHNLMWRKTSADILLTISRNSLSQPVISYFHNKGCISLCVDNMQKSTELTPLEVVEMFVTVFCFLKDSAQDSQTLLDDFRTCQGYVFLTEFLLKLEQFTPDQTEANEAIRNLVLLVASLTFCGHSELRPSSIADVAAISLFQLSSFELPEPENKGSTVRNLQAFQVLQSAFLKSTSQQLGATIMDALSTIYTSDNANYFLLEHQHTLPQFAERIFHKAKIVQEKFFQLVEFLVHHLKFVPCKEFISISLLLKSHQSTGCSVLALQSLISILRFDTTFKDVFREIGLLEVFVGCLRDFIDYMNKRKSDPHIHQVNQNMEDLGDRVSTILVYMLTNSSQNSTVFRDSEGTKTILRLAEFPGGRTSALTLMQQLILSGGNEDDMTSMLELLHSAAFSEHSAKAEVLSVVINCLKESHRSRTVFRKVGGFVYITSVLVSAENSLRSLERHDDQPGDREAYLSNVYSLLRLTFSCLAVAMRYEPANAKFFHTEVASEPKFLDTILRLGCFSEQTQLIHITKKPRDYFCKIFRDVLNGEESQDEQEETSEETHDHPEVPESLLSACIVIKFLYNMAEDNQDGRRGTRARLTRTKALSSSDTSAPNGLQLQETLPDSRNSVSRSSVSIENQRSPISSTSEEINAEEPKTKGSSSSFSDVFTETKQKRKTRIAKLSFSPAVTGGSSGSGLSGAASVLTSEPIIVHPAIVTVILKLLPHLYHPVNSVRTEQAEDDFASETEEASVALQLQVSELLRLMLKTEKNQQIMCNVGLVADAVQICRPALEDEAHVLHVPFQYLLERLAAQKLEPMDLRIFLRMGNPLACLNDEGIAGRSAASCNSHHSDLEDTGSTQHSLKSGGFLPLTRVKTLVSMTTPRDLHMQNNSILPPFIEFDMVPEGFGCLYVPSLCPTSPYNASVVGVTSLATQESSVLGGIGMGDRAFPPHTGLTFSTWFCIDKFSDPRCDPHPVRLLTLARIVKNGNSEDHLACLAICLSSRDKAFIISSQEAQISKSNDWQPDFNGEGGARVWFPDLIKEGEWHHLVVVLNKQVLKNSSFSLYVNGQHISTQRMHYISQNPGGGAANLQVASSVYGFIGTPPNWRRISRLCWKQGPCQMFEDAASPQLACLLYRLGPHYLGSLQAPQISTTGEVMTSQIAEEKIMIGLNAVAVTQMTLAKIKKVYSKVDNKSIARQLGMASGENATPIWVVHNSAGHLLGPARSLGGVAIGYLGVRLFNPQPVSKVIETVGGCDVLLGIVAMARDTEGLYAGIKALVCVLKGNPFARYEMDSNKGYQTLGLLLRRKLQLLNAHILHLIFAMAGTTDSSSVTKDGAGIPNVAAFRDILCDLELWHEATGDLEKSLYDHFLELICDGQAAKQSLNQQDISAGKSASVDQASAQLQLQQVQPQAGVIHRTLREFNLVEKLLAILKRSESSNAGSLTLMKVVHGLLCSNPRVTDVLSFALFTAATLNRSSASEGTLLAHLDLGNEGTQLPESDASSCKSDQKVEEGLAVNTTPEVAVAKIIVLRNRCLKLFFSLLYMDKSIHVKYCEDVVQVVGFDWVLLFLQGHLHPTTVVWGLRILMTLLSQPVLLQKFRMGTCNGHWLTKSEIVLQNKMNKALGQSSNAASKATRKGLIRQDIFLVPGFQMLNWLMPCHAQVPEVYFLLMAMALGQPVKTLPETIKFDLDSIWRYIFGTSPVEASSSDIACRVNLSGDTIVTMLCIVRKMLNNDSTDPERLPICLKDYPVTLTQFFFYLYHNVADFMPVFMTAEVLRALAGTLFPAVSSSDESMSSSPDDSPFSSPSRESSSAVKSGGDDKADKENEEMPGDATNVQMDSLSNHPAKRNVMNFIRVLIVDSLSLPVTPKNPPVLDLLLDAQPENTTRAQQNRFQTELLSLIMDHLLAADILIGDQAALCGVPGGSPQYIPPNVFYLANRIVDKLWQGILAGKDPDDVFQFTLKLISQAKRRSDGGSLNLESIYKCLNRTILYLLSGPHVKQPNSLASHMAVLDALQTIVKGRNVIFGAGNHEVEFFGCLTLCLLKLTANEKIPLGDGNNGDSGSPTTTWHVKMSLDTTVSAEGDHAKLQQSQNLLINSSARVWEVMYVSKRPVLEEVFKCSFGQHNTTPPLELVQPLIMEAAARVWQSYLEAERKAALNKPHAWEFHYQLESRIQRITGGLTGGLKRLTSVGGGSVSSSGSGGGAKAAKREDLPKVCYSPLPRDVVAQSTLAHIAVVKEVVDQSYKNRIQTTTHMLKYIEEEWLETERRLTQERGLWGPFNETSLTKWMLNMTEGPSRMRKKMVRNELFYFHYPYRRRRPRNGVTTDLVDDDNEDVDEKPHKYKKPSSADSKRWFESHHNVAMFERTDSEEAKAMILRMSEEMTDFDDCDINVADKSLTIDEQMKRIGFQDLKAAIGQATSAAAFLKDRHQSGSSLGNPEDQNNSNQQIEEDSSCNSDSADHLGNEGKIASPAEHSLSGPSSLSSATSSSSAHQQQQVEVAQTLEEQSPEYQTVMRLLENGERISQMYRCTRILGLDTVEGLLLFGKEHFYILDGFTLLNGREVHDIDFIPTTYYDPIIPQVPGQINRVKYKREVMKLAYDSVKEVHMRRYLLQPIAVEVFCANGDNLLLAFLKQSRPNAYAKFLSVATSIADSAQLSIAGQKRSANVEQGSGLLSSLMGETSVTQRWVRGEITNFQYLMALNTLAGRSYNDLMQYPVFPWVLADYSSEELDLSDPSTFRDLSKPMGAQTRARLQQFKRRYAEWEDPQLETAPYFYGTHYSSAMIVSSYLVRMEPFTQHFLHLQGGHFDLPDRMFHSIEEAWDSASRNNMADLRELIPEFFYLPDFLTNQNKFDLGTKQNGEKLKNVLLPCWAKNSPEEFIRAHREALECDYVSAHLHEWIDLIFGYKQQGQAAVDAVNVFHPLFYEGNVDIFSISDPLQRNATIGFINNFGQIPKQLFKRPHPAKKLNKSNQGNVEPASGTHSYSSKVFFHHLTNLKPSMVPVKELKGPVGQIQHSDRVVYAVEQNKVLVPGNCNRYLAWGYADQSFRLGNYDSDKAVFICEPNYLIGQVLTCVCPNSKVVLTAGTSSVVAVYEYHKKVKQLLIKRMLYGHTDAVTCLAASPGWNISVSGSRDRTAIIWDLSSYVYVKHLSGHAGPISAVAINELTGEIATCAGSWLYLWDINGRRMASVNTACKLNTSTPAGIDPSTNHPSYLAPHLHHSATGQLGVGCEDTVDHCGTGSEGGPSSQHQILCVTFSQYNEWDRENVIITGSSDGVVRMWSLDYVEVPVDGRSSRGEERATKVAQGSSSDSVKIDNISEFPENADKNMTVSSSADCLSSVREAIAAHHRIAQDEADDDDDEDEGDEDKERPLGGEKKVKSTNRPKEKTDETERLSHSSSSDTEVCEEAGPEREDHDDTASIKALQDGEDCQDSGEGARVPLLSSSSSPPPSVSDFVVVPHPFNDGEGKKARGRSTRQQRDGSDGYSWSRQLVFRAKLTMHTAYERHDNVDPAAVTALAISKDHRTIYVGDEKGRVWSWSVTSKPGKGMVDHWWKDEGATGCVDCGVKFTIYERKHHCRKCGKVFCSSCSQYQAEIPRLNIHQPVRVCKPCFTALQLGPDALPSSFLPAEK